MTDALLTKQQAAERLNISLWALDQELKRGHIPVVPVGCRIRIRQSDLDAYINNIVYLA